MNITKEDKKIEAIERMRMIGLYDQTIQQFIDDDLVSESEPPIGACYWIDDDLKERVERFENHVRGLVYHIIHAYSSEAETMTYFYVSDHRDEWNDDRENIKEGIAFCYVENLTAPDCSELGYIGFKLSPAAGLLRTY